MKHPDLNLLVALDVLLEEQSVVAAGRRMGLSAAAMSRTLTRIRGVLGDPVLVRAGKKLVPTPRALELHELVHRTAASAVGLLQMVSAKKLADLERQFVVRANDVFVSAYGGRLIEALSAEAPKVILRFTAETEIDDEALREGRIDLWVGATRTLDPEVRVQMLFTTRFVGLASKRHPIFEGEITPGRFASYAQINVSRRGLATSPIDTKLAEHGLRRKVVLIAPSFSVGLFTLASSELIMPVPEHVVLGLDKLGADVRSFSLPLKLDPFALRQAWHPRLENDAAHTWLRSTIARICRSVPG